jgi:cytidylate kinase
VIIAVDGPVAAGKGTLARRLAAHYGFAYLDSGSLYRAVGRKLLKAGVDPADAARAAAAAAALTPADLADPALRDEATGAAASVVGAIPAVRAALLDYQRKFAHSPPNGAAGAVLDGRDIGTVVCPDATVKLYVTATPEVRAVRRFREIQAQGSGETYDQVLADLKERDRRDSTRAVAPLRPAADAHLLDTSDLAIDDAFARAKAIIDGQLRR